MIGFVIMFAVALLLRVVLTIKKAFVLTILRVLVILIGYLLLIK